MKLSKKDKDLEKRIRRHIKTLKKEENKLYECLEYIKNGPYSPFEKAFPEWLKKNSSSTYND
ncbi:hypothetical protein CMO90_03910 [Candidatus Woesearchaeota archaeon]|jgi:hypothetical protein|nr:hypothetical protein [Candidatus Woesearchaeota archaeon]|tara:strand:+ start:189 stop:374 length:186 start_codon:yes stop_codon:yes gene_type:complete